MSRGRFAATSRFVVLVALAAAGTANAQTPDFSPYRRAVRKLDDFRALAVPRSDGAGGSHKVCSPREKLAADPAKGLAATHNLVHSIYVDRAPGGVVPQLEYRRSTDGGLTFGPPTVVHGLQPGEKLDPGATQLHCEGNTVFIALRSSRFDLHRGNMGAVVYGSQDQGKTWKKEKQLTRGSEFNHTYVRRPVHAHPDFYAFWADGHGRRPSESRLYFTNRSADHAWRLPVQMSGEFAKPGIAW